MKKTTSPEELLKGKIEFKQNVLNRLTALKQSDVASPSKSTGVSPEKIKLEQSLFKKMVEGIKEMLGNDYAHEFAQKKSLASIANFHCKKHNKQKELTNLL